MLGEKTRRSLRKGVSHCVAVIPPSTYNVWPVMKSEAGGTKKSTARITSSGSAMRPKGIRDTGAL